MKTFDSRYTILRSDELDLAYDAVVKAIKEDYDGELCTTHAAKAIQFALYCDLKYALAIIDELLDSGALKEHRVYLDDEVYESFYYTGPTQ